VSLVDVSRRERIDADWSPVAIGRYIADEVDDLEQAVETRSMKVEAKLDQISTRSLYNLAGLATASVLLLLDILVRTAGGG
jgi:hypothetical protein